MQQEVQYQILKHKSLIVLCFLNFAFYTCESKIRKESMLNNSISIIPQPQSVKLKDGTTNLKSLKQISLENDLNEERIVGNLFKNFLLSIHENGLTITTQKHGSNEIYINLDPGLKIKEEGYILEVTKENLIKVIASSSSGLFYAFQSFRQLLDPNIEIGRGENFKITNCRIKDEPTYGYRGMHLDVSRHFFNVDFIKTYIDMIALHKMNIFHWHLTDDNGWRIEIDAYPELTTTAAWRVDRRHEPWKEWSPIQKGEKATYGGFYSKDDIKEVVQYAKDRHIKIIPEIEMPGHTSEVFSAYPELSCNGEYIPVNPGSYWPNTDIFCAGNDNVFTFLENVLGEVFELFPGNYIHIGGDEADKTNWKKCPKCQKRIKEEGLKDEHELQSWFIKRIEKFVLSRKKDLIGWDEILEGGLAQSATVMSWRGTKGGVEAAKLGHEVVMCPVTHCYFDYYQSDPEKAPKAFGGLITLKKVYSYNPIPENLPIEKTHLVLGGQGNLWTEYVQNPDIAQYRVLPRMSALSEVLWSDPSQRNYENFYKRLLSLQKRFVLLGWNFSEGSKEVLMDSFRDTLNNTMTISISSEKPDKPIFYSLDSSDVTSNSLLYTEPFIINKTTRIKSALFEKEKRIGKVLSQVFSIHKAIGKDIEYKTLYSDRYSGSGIDNLINGVNGTTSYNDGKWQGWKGENANLIIDFKKEDLINEVIFGFLESHDVWIFLPKKINVSFLDERLTVLKRDSLFIEQSKTAKPPNRKQFKIKNTNITCRYIEITVENQGLCPEWHPGNGSHTWLFMDEISVN